LRNKPDRVTKLAAIKTAVATFALTFHGDVVADFEGMNEENDETPFSNDFKG